MEPAKEDVSVNVTEALPQATCVLIPKVATGEGAVKTVLVVSPTQPVELINLNLVG